MTLKEFPLVKAVSQADALPGFVVANPFVAGFFAMLASALLGAILVAFPVISTDALLTDRFNMIRGFAIGGAALCAIIQIGVAISALFIADEAETRLQFATGGWAGFALLAAADHLCTDRIRAWLETLANTPWAS